MFHRAAYASYSSHSTKGHMELVGTAPFHIPSLAEITKFFKHLRTQPRDFKWNKLITSSQIPRSKSERYAWTEMTLRKQCVLPENCDTMEHKSFTCPNVTSVPERKSILVQKRLCFNCTGPHKVVECCSKTSCQIFRRNIIHQYVILNGTWKEC